MDVNLTSRVHSEKTKDLKTDQLYLFRDSIRTSNKHSEGDYESKSDRQ